MSKRNPKPLLIDMLQSIEKIMDYTSGMSYESFLADSKTKDAVTRNVQILGEAANKISESFRTQNPDIEWTKIIRSRHIVTHDYGDLDYAIIWKIITIHLTPLKQSLEKILSGL